MYTPDGCRTLIGALQDDNLYANDVNSDVDVGVEMEVEMEGREGLKERARNMNLKSITGFHLDDDSINSNNKSNNGHNSSSNSTTCQNSSSSSSSSSGYSNKRIHSQHNENCSNRDRGINFEVYHGDRVLIAGPSGNGKSSLLRAISGLWELGSGRVTWNTNIDFNSVIGTAIETGTRIGIDVGMEMGMGLGSDTGVGMGMDMSGAGYKGNKAPFGVFFLPQKPYNLLGSLRQQISYPSICPDHDSTAEMTGNLNSNLTGIGIGTEVDDETMSSSNSNLIHSGARLNLSKKKTHSPLSECDSKLIEILTRVRLGTLASRMGSGDEETGLGVHKDWTKVLSLGEQQRLAFARVLYNRKNISVVVLDEATSALDESAEAAMYGLLGDLSVTYLSVGHRASLYKFHTKKITLNGPGREVDCVVL